MKASKPWLPWLLGLGTCLALAGPALDPSVQLYYRDTFRWAYPCKAFISQQLHAWRSPFWVPWTEAGTSILTLVVPGIFHPFTLLYALPFELAFKLNHLLALPLAFAATFLLARKLGASEWWGAAAGAVGYAGSGYLLSVVSSNVPYALGSAAMPLALHGFLRFVQNPRPLRLLWAAAALALCALGGDPQSMLLGGFLGAVFVVRTPRTLRLTAAWGACALLLSAPAIGPVIYRLRHGTRATGVTRGDLAAFANTPPRLAGLLVPIAFDDRQEEVAGGEAQPYSDYFRGSQEDAFSDSIVLGAPILLLAFASRRKWLLLGALVFALGSAGSSLPIQRVLLYAIPGLGFFRYAEKLIAPCSLLLCLAASFCTDRKLLQRLCFVAIALLGLSWIGAHFLSQDWLRQHGRTHSQHAAEMFERGLQTGLLIELALAAVLALASRSAALPALVCAAGAWIHGRDRIATAPLEVLQARLKLGDELIARAGPSAGRWRIRADAPLVQLYKGLDQRLARTIAGAQSLEPMYHWLAGIESVTEYNSLGDRDYHDALDLAPEAFNRLMGVRFDLRQRFTMTAEEAHSRGYQPAAFGEWVGEFRERPRAFLAVCTNFRNPIESMKYDPATMVVARNLDLPCKGDPGEAHLERSQPSQMTAYTLAPRTQLLVVAEHYDPGWSATLDGKPAEVLEVDLSALGVVVPEGQHEVRLRFFPQHLWLSLFLAAGTAGALLLLHLLQRQHRVRPAEPE